MSKNDSKIKTLLTNINDKKKEMGDKPKGNWKTNGVLKLSDGTSSNLNTINSADMCIELAAKLLFEKTHYSEACKFLGLPEKVSEKALWINDALEDVKFRTQMVLWDIEKKKLDAMEKKLKDLRSEDAKTEEALEDIEKALV